MQLLLRWTGAFLLALCGGGTGLYLYHRVSLRRKTLQQIHQLLQHLQEEVRYRKADFQRLYRQMQAEELFPLLRFPADGCFQSIAAPDVLRREEADCFADCLGGLGTAGAAQECTRLEYYIQRFSTFCTQAEAEEVQARQLYTRLGFGAGVMLAISFL